MQASNYHIPVMLNECIEALNIKSDGVYVDATYGGGGHAKLILSKLGEHGRLIGFDQDPDAAERVEDHDNLIFVNHNFQFVKNFLKFYDIEKVDGILADLGISSHQIDEGSRGFSYRFDAPIDMRMGQTTGLSAADVLNTYNVEDLSRIFRVYGELKYAWKLAQKIVETRKSNPINTTGELVDLLAEFCPPHNRNRELAQAFQALRIEVNHEMDSLNTLLAVSCELLKPKGRLVVMSYHSLEDRLVKNYMSAGNEDGETHFDAYGSIKPPLKLLSRKPITPSQEELVTNPRSRSAKLRIAEKI